MVLGWPFMDSFFESIGALSALAIKWSAGMFSNSWSGRMARRGISERFLSFKDVQPPKEKNMTCYTAVRGYNQLLANVTKATTLAAFGN